MHRNVRSLITAGLAMATIAVAAAAVSPAANAAAADDRGSTLTAGQQLDIGQYLSNGDYRLTMQNSGNLVLTKGTTALFASNTYNSGAHNYARFQSNGDFVLYHAGTDAQLWKTVTNGSGAGRVTLQSDGNLVLYKGSTAVWATMTNGGRNQLQNSKIYSIALGMVGKYPYQYGAGHGATPGPTDGRLDCSGLVRWVYYLASGKDILDGNTTTQYADVKNSKHSIGAPGDLIFYYDTDAGSMHHVGIFAGDGHLINEYDSGYVTLVNGVDDSYGTQYKYYDRSW